MSSASDDLQDYYLESYDLFTTNPSTLTENRYKTHSTGFYEKEILIVYSKTDNLNHATNKYIINGSQYYED
jgi:hypothetical protein